MRQLVVVKTDGCCFCVVSVVVFGLAVLHVPLVSLGVILVVLGLEFIVLHVLVDFHVMVVVGIHVLFLSPRPHPPPPQKKKKNRRVMRRIAVLLVFCWLGGGFPPPPPKIREDK